jgi:hypothetical protein
MSLKAKEPKLSKASRSQFVTDSISMEILMSNQHKTPVDIT